jgi:hypothetical protein
MDDHVPPWLKIVPIIIMIVTARFLYWVLTTDPKFGSLIELLSWFSVRDGIWLTVVMAVILGWWLDLRRLARRQKEGELPSAPITGKPVKPSYRDTPLTD